MSEKEREVMGYAWSVDTGGRGFFHSWGSTPASVPPAQLPQHVGLFAFGHIYEFSAMGVTACMLGSNSEVISQCNVAIEPTRVVSLGTAAITMEQFHEWLHSSHGAFNETNFNITNHNSVTWAEEASRILGVRPDEEWSTFRNYYLNNAASLQKLAYAKANGVSRHQWVRNSEKNCCVT